MRDAAQARQLLEWARSLDANFVRLAHYPHNEHMARLADEMGLLVWSEIPVYWTIDWGNEATYRNAEAQLEAMIGRDRNRASVIIWSLANETPVSDARNRFLSRLAARARALDDSRLLSAAMEKHYREDDPDVAVVERGAEGDRHHHPATARLVIEVAGDSLRKDRVAKAAVYAGAGIPEYAIVNLEEDVVEVYRDPDAGARRYLSATTLGAADMFTSAAVPGFSFSVGSLLK